ncbi:hypothetical protein LDC_0565 [sediment metagenome]|uniref:Uncharacterized protein n=1 Tax=sediment metagenome TaxID=749907 RepID=D9PGB8_9ZZZZ
MKPQKAKKHYDLYHAGNHYARQFTDKELIESLNLVPGSGKFPRIHQWFGNSLAWIVEHHMEIDYKGFPVAGALYEPLMSFGLAEFYGLKKAMEFWLRQLSARIIDTCDSLKLSPKVVSMQPDILALIEYCTQSHDIEAFDKIESAKGVLRVEYWATQSTRRKDIKRFLSSVSAPMADKLNNIPSILSLYANIAELGYKFKFPGEGNTATRITHWSWWQRWSYLLATATPAIERLLDARKPKVVLVTSDYSIFGYLLILAARRRHIPSIHIPHGYPNPLLLPLRADYMVVWGKPFVELLAVHGLATSRMLVTGDILGGKARPASKRDYDLRKKLGISQPNVIGYLATAAEVGNEGLLAMIEAIKNNEDYCLLIRPHPRQHEYASDLAAKIGVGRIKIITADILSLEQFCSICNIAATFESTSLFYAIREGCLPIQVTAYNKRAPAIDFTKLTEAPEAANTEQLSIIINQYFNIKSKDELDLKQDKIIRMLYAATGMDAANSLVASITDIISKQANIPAAG